MTSLRPELPELPTRIASLPVDRRGYPVPWFVRWIDGEPDHRIMVDEKRSIAWERSLCWICGQPLGGATVTFAIGPMCAINRVSAEPPSHKECCLFSVKGCPFLSRPHAKRRDVEGAIEPDGNMLRRNPGVILLWTTKRIHCGPFGLPDGGFLFDVGKPEECLWFCEGREATRAEVEASIEGGLPTLKAMAVDDGIAAEEELQQRIETAWELLPVAA